MVVRESLKRIMQPLIEVKKNLWKKKYRKKLKVKLSVPLTWEFLSKISAWYHI